MTTMLPISNCSTKVPPCLHRITAPFVKQTGNGSTITPSESKLNSLLNMESIVSLSMAGFSLKKNSRSQPVTVITAKPSPTRSMPLTINCGSYAKWPENSIVNVVHAPPSTLIQVLPSTNPVPGCPRIRSPIVAPPSGVLENRISTNATFFKPSTLIELLPRTNYHHVPNMLEIMPLAPPIKFNSFVDTDVKQAMLQSHSV